MALASQASRAPPSWGDPRVPINFISGAVHADRASFQYVAVPGLPLPSVIAYAEQKHASCVMYAWEPCTVRAPTAHIHPSRFSYSPSYLLYGPFVQMISYRRTCPLAKPCSSPKPFAHCCHHCLIGTRVRSDVESGVRPPAVKDVGQFRLASYIRWGHI
jgi:hypothetical protein